MSTLTPLALQNADVLRAIAAGDLTQAGSIAAFAKGLGRDPSNLRKSLAGLGADGLVWGDELTDKGRQVIAALDRADGQAVQATAPSTLFRPNPHNPRPFEDFDDESLDEMAGSIAESGLLLPILVTPPVDDKSGVRVILDGERRWRSVRRAIERQLVAADYPIPYAEKAVDAAELAAITAQLALTANGTGKPLPRLAEARAFVVVMEARGWTAAQLAEKIGRKPRVVQEAVRVVRQANPDAIALFESGALTWEGLRDSVREEGGRGWSERKAGDEAADAPASLPADETGKPDGVALYQALAGKAAPAIPEGTDPRLVVNGKVYPNLTHAQEARYRLGIDQRPRANYGGGTQMDRAFAEVDKLPPRAVLALVEIADKLAREPSAEHPSWTACAQDTTGPDRLSGRLPYLGGGFMSAALSGGRTRFSGVMLGRRLETWLEERDQHPAKGPRDVILAEARAAAGLTKAEIAALGDRYATAWLNVDDEPALDLPQPPPSAGPVELSPRAACALVELSVAIDKAACGDGPTLDDVPAAPVYRVPLCAFAPELTRAGLATFKPIGALQGWAGIITPAGRRWLREEGFAEQNPAGALNRARYFAGQVDWRGDGFVTPWLNKPADDDQAAPAPAVEAEQLDLDRQAREAADARGEELLRQVLTLTEDAETPIGALAFSTLLADLGAPAPWQATGIVPGEIASASGEPILAVAYGGLGEDALNAVAELVAYAVNRAAGAANL